ncbi:Anaphase-promoting complex subunit 4 [Erysiphe neolycopersici]|uniref:Anaphase-promoting complex subunit 4 n=1 Tax=Erysiphe neolycopersici TaxID=212602 RepID=A0A420I3L0_9PEZI|nr:Anaphase-promoting complex subunit 4 [Erysiphe neolycopersici]
MESQEKLHVMSDKSLSQVIIPGLISYCPSIDLVALCTIESHVSVYRLNGQLVYGAAQKQNDLQVDSIQWKPNGKLFATAWNDGCVRLICAETCKTVHQFSNDHQVTKVTCMGWCSNKTANSTASNYINDTKGIEKLIQDDNKDFFEDPALLLDLPRDLSLIDIETSLPKLSTLPAGGDSEDIFCTRSSLDALISPFDPKDNNAVDVMIFGTKEGRIQIIIYDSFFIGSFESPVTINGSSCFLTLHSSHENSSTHALIFKHPETKNLFFTTIDLRFISASNGNLSLLASRSTALQNLLRYVFQVQNLMFLEWKASRELPDKFLGSINKILNEEYNCDIVQALCHSLATGHVYPPIKEWLMHEISERGHKRWEKAVLTGLGNLKRIIHENMLPALDRFTVILSRFFGIAKFQPIEEGVGFTCQHISLLMDTISCLHLISSKILSQVVDEIDLFISFSAWMRYQIDQLTKDSSSTLADDTTDKESLIDHSKVFFYLQTNLTCTPLADHFTDSPSLEEIKFFSQAQKPMFETISQHLKKQCQGLVYNKSILCLKFHCDELSLRAKSLFKGIAGSEKCNVIFGKECLIGMAEPDSPMDLKLAMQDTSTFPSYFAFVPKGMPHCVRIIRVKLSLHNGISSYDCLGSFTVQLGEGSIKDMKFFDGNNLLVLWKFDRGKESTKLLILPYRGVDKATSRQATKYMKCTDNLNLEYAPYIPNSSLNSSSTTDMSKPDIFIETQNVSQLFSKYEIPSEENQFKPESICVRKTFDGIQYQNHELMTMSKSTDDQRIVLLDQERFRYKVFSISRIM